MRVLKTMMFSNNTPRLHVFFLVAISTILGLTSIYSLVLKCAALDVRKEHISQFYTAPDSSHPYTVAVNNTLPMFPVHLNEGATVPVIASGALSLALSLVAISFACQSLSNGPFSVSIRAEPRKLNRETKT